MINSRCRIEKKKHDFSTYLKFSLVDTTKNVNRNTFLPYNAKTNSKLK